MQKIKSHACFRAITYPALLLAICTAAGIILPIDQFLSAQTQDDRRIQRIDLLPERQDQSRRVALVVGNSNYAQSIPLRNPRNDAKVMAATLEDLGFEVIHLLDGTKEEMDLALVKFFRAMQEGDTAVFYYAGHGIQSDGKNYLIPVDARLVSEGRLQYEAVALGEVLNYMEDAGTQNNIVILDACRDNPFARSWSRSRSGGISQGLASTQRSKVLIAYATAPGEVAADGDEEHGVYTSALLNHLNTPGQDVLLMLRAVAAEVLQKTNNRQQPFFTVGGSFWFSFNPDQDDREASNSTPQPTPSSTPQPTPSSTPQPTPSSTPQPTPSSTPQPTPSSTPQPTPSSTPQSTPSSTPQPTPNSTPQPTPSSTPQPTPSSTPNSTPQPTPQPTPNSTPQSTPSFQSKTFLGIPVEPFSFTTVTINSNAEISPLTQQAKVGRYVETQLNLPPGSIPLSLVAIEGGTFMMGQTEAEKQQLIKDAGQEIYNNFYSSEIPRHQVTVSDFLLGQYEVTQAQYEAVMGENPTTGEAWIWNGVESKPDTQIPEKFLGQNKPVIGVSWEDAQEFMAH
jgi:outer membrane biosynthesis protein TonB